MEILSKDMIERWILPHLLLGKRGFSSKVPVCEIVMLILYKLKTGCQWRYLPVKQFFEQEQLTWQGVYYHFNRWSKLDCWKQVWVHLLAQHHAYLDLSSAQLDGSHTLAKNGGESIGYQGRKAAKTCNSLFIADNQGLMLSMASPQEGNHHDLYEIETLFEQLTQLLQEAGIDLRGVFLNADPGFDCQTLRKVCQQKQIQPNIKNNPRNNPQEDYQYFDEELYKRRTVIERANAWLDSFKALLIRFETLVTTWVAFHLIAFAVIFIRKINKAPKV
ncbi:MAG TPA: IS5 family transposase [Pedobacter sp.]|jgi:transposase